MMGGKRLRKLIIGTVVIGSAGCYLLYLAAESSWLYYFSVDEFVQSDLVQVSQSAQPTASGAVIRLAGWVKPGSIARDSEKMRLDFELSGQQHSIAVTYGGPEVPNIASGREVLVEGMLGQGGVFEASRIMTRCESKYKAKLKD